jgi:hypothetical protein
MRSFKQCAASAAALATGVVLMFAGTALAAFPDFTGCPASTPTATACIDVQNSSGNLNIKGFNVPLTAAALEIRGGIAPSGGGVAFIPPRGTTGFFSRAVPVPGGLLGIEWIPGTSVLAITELAGSPSNIRFDLATFGLAVPVKVRLVNTLLGMNCHVGTDRNPVRLNLITGTTSPPAPNRPISGSPGRFEFVPPDTILVPNNRNVENSFAVPGATECGLGLGLINSLVNLKLRLPSAAGNNSIEVVNNIAIKELFLE